jgi:hypothetical protein
MKLQFFRFLALVIVLLTYSHSPVFAQVVWGDFDSRTEYRADAGLRGDAGAKSGFYNTSNPTNFPSGATDWWHLLDVRHSNPSNNYAMQFAGSFYDQSLYFRKTNNNPATPWSRILLETGGKVGIGTTAPNYQLDVNGVVSLTDRLFKQSPSPGGVNPTLIGAQTEHVQGEIPIISLGYEQGAAAGTDMDTKIRSYARDPSESQNFIVIGRERIDLSAGHTYVTGSLGIGTANTGSYKLAVEGIVGARKVKITQATWADYVFDSSYQLRPLSEVESFIRKNNHLPDMPAAKEVEARGLDLGEIVKQQQVKIEELTLYLIELKKENEAIKKQNDLIVNMNGELQNRLEKLEK